MKIDTAAITSPDSYQVVEVVEKPLSPLPISSTINSD